MALKGNREIYRTDISRNCTTVAEEGVVLVRAATGGSGMVVAGDGASTCALVADPSGYKVHGLLTYPVVDVDTTLYHMNFHKTQSLINERCEVVREGRLVTNKITGTPVDGDVAYLTANGVLTPTVDADGGVAATPKVGQFVGSKDENSYCTVDVSLPVL